MYYECIFTLNVYKLQYIIFSNKKIRYAVVNKYEIYKGLTFKMLISNSNKAHNKRQIIVFNICYTLIHNSVFL